MTRFLILTIIALLPTYVVRFHIGSFPTTVLEALILFLFSWWFIERIVTPPPFHEVPLNGWEGGARGGYGEHGDITTPNPSFKRRGVAIVQMLTATIPASLRAPIVLFLLASIISVAIAPNHMAALGLWRAYILEPLIFFIIFLHVVRRGWPTLWRDIAIALSISALGVSFVAAWQWFDPTGLGIFPIPNPVWIPEDVRRVTSVYGFPNALGLFLAPIVVFLIGTLLYSPPFQGGARGGYGGLDEITTRSPSLKRRGVRNIAFLILLTTATLAATLSIFLARSDGAVVALIVGIIFLGIMHRRLRWWTIGIIAITTLSLVIAPLLFLPTGQAGEGRLGGVTLLRSAFADKFLFREPSGQIRIEQWLGTIAMLRDRPLTGAGLAGYPTVFAPYNRQSHIEVFQYPHTILLNLWSELGLLGVLAFGWIVVVFFREAWHRRGSPPFQGGARGGYGTGSSVANHQSQIIYLKSMTLMSVMLVILIHGLVDVPYFKNDLALFFWIPFVLLFGNNAVIARSEATKQS